jgi:MOSC domain-containing protein YiiM
MWCIESIQLGRVETIPADEGGDTWVTATYKHPISSAVKMTALGVEGDQQADRKNHGGPDKAVLVYPAEHLDYWRKELQKPDFSYGALGENLSVLGASEADVCIGDRFEIGEAVVEISQPRQPCWKQSRRWDRVDFVPLIQKAGKTGWYLRVLREGMIEQGLTAKLLERVHGDWSVAKANQIMYFDKENVDGTRALIGLERLSASWKNSLTRRLGSTS